jgi:hypothetical protein
MVTRLTGAVVRAVLVVLLIAMPSILVPQTSSDTSQVVILLALLAGAFTLFEYGSASPSLVEFRDAPPFNRIRFVALALSVFALSVILRGATEPTTLTRLFATAGGAIAAALDFPYSPVRLVVLMMPESADAALVDRIRVAAGLSYLVSILALVVFVLAIRMGGWPVRRGGFNVWTNLPLFDPTAGGDVVRRMSRDSQVNLVLGFLLPFVIPAVVKLTALILDPVTLHDPQTLIWTMTAWAFLPASLLMRGIALARVAGLISAQRRRALGAGAARGLQPV